MLPGLGLKFFCSVLPEPSTGAGVGDGTAGGAPGGLWHQPLPLVIS